jgi:YD repeat-containing protein
MRCGMKLWAMALAAVFSSTCYAVVDMKNANFSQTWVDAEVPGSGYDLRVQRTYNSRSLFNGIFGFGWCSDFETKMAITAEGNLKITECGAGQEVFFYPREVSRSDIDSTIGKIISKMKEEKVVGRTEEFYKKLSAELLELDVKRSQLANQYNITVPVKPGSRFFANGREVETITLEKTYYTRALQDGSSQRFDLKGRMTHMYDKNGNFLKFEYENENMVQITDNNSRKLSFRYFPSKKVKEISGPNSLKVEYQYQDLDDLSYVKNAWKNVYTYKYDELHNMVLATWPDKTSIALKYDTKNDWVTSFTDRNKCVESYGYELSRDNPKGHYWSTVKKVCGKEVVADDKYEFWYKQRKDGEWALSRVLSDVKGNLTDINYDDVTGKPTAIRRNQDRLVFEYYPNGLVKMKAGTNSKQHFKYDGANNKISEVITEFFNQKGEKVATRTTSFKYDQKGNLVYAQNSDGQKVNMTYDPLGRIASITDQAKKLVKIQYEERYGKPSVVTRPGLGTIKVSYRPSGEIDKVDTKDGPSVALQVASTFNNMLDIIAPATTDVYL